MAEFLTDREIQDLVQEPKRVPADIRRRMVPRAKRGHSEVDIDVRGDLGSEFRIIVRRSKFNVLDFSCILGYRVLASNQVLRLRRYNGKSHEHTNPIEGETFYDFHIHLATERYQRTGNREDTYAQVSDRFSSFEEAVKCLFEDCHVVFPDEPQMQLFSP